MDCCFDNRIKKLEELKFKYDSYNELDKLSMTRYINDCFKEVIDRKYINYYDDEMVKKIHNMILKLDSLTSLVDFDVILFDMYCEYSNKEFIEEEVNNVLKLAYKKLEPFVSCGLSNQLQVKRYCDVNPFKFNNLVLDDIGREFALDVIKTIEYFEWVVKFKLKVNIDVVSQLYRDLSTEQLAFIYCQLDYWDTTMEDGLEYGTDYFDTGERVERIFDVLRDRSKLDKIKFIEIVRNLGYSLEAMGILAMIVELLSENSYEDVNHILWMIYSNRLEGDPRTLEIDIVQNMKYAIKIKELRDEDIRNGKKLSTIYEYEQRSFYNDYKSYGRVR